MATFEQFSMDQEVAIVTGAAGGLGCELARILAAANATVVLVDINEQAIVELENELTSQGLSAVAKVCDITNVQSIEGLVKDIDLQHQRIDVLVNCAGILGSNEPMFNIMAEEWDAVMTINLKATWQMSTIIAGYMLEKTIHGRIVNISSSLGGRAQLKRIHYATSKAGVEHLTRNMAMELVKQNIRVNCLAPGWLATPMVKDILDGPEGEHWRKTIPMGRAADPQELTGALLLLASRASSYMTGSVLRVDGGYSYRGIECDF
ncbi:SDR family oxidoreductase [bacterium]|jgi:NAD(P)-dependent dehydrogenase (short-subunit alcohol dehydrogenase family)|nr:SDR family oxidoreductase [Rubripirellula sp.]MDB4653901.1 SDR family oxidoreductase [bacterium]MDB4654183.1 SDR family oxidoreductase [Rubripirellula sp.]